MIFWPLSYSVTAYSFSAFWTIAPDSGNQTCHIVTLWWVVGSGTSPLLTTEANSQCCSCCLVRSIMTASDQMIPLRVSHGGRWWANLAVECLSAYRQLLLYDANKVELCLPILVVSNGKANWEVIYIWHITVAWMHCISQLCGSCNITSEHLS